MYDSDTIILKSLKSKDFSFLFSLFSFLFSLFSFWLNLVNIYYKGYHTISEGHYLLGAIKLHLNKHTIRTNTYLLDDMQRISIYKT